jgi:hypothetical protein
MDAETFSTFLGDTDLAKWPTSLGRKDEEFGDQGKDEGSAIKERTRSSARFDVRRDFALNRSSQMKALQTSLGDLKNQKCQIFAFDLCHCSVRSQRDKCSELSRAATMGKAGH